MKQPAVWETGPWKPRQSGIGLQQEVQREAWVDLLRTPPPGCLGPPGAGRWLNLQDFQNFPRCTRAKRMQPRYLGTVVHLLVESKRHTLWPGDSISAFSSINRCKDAQSSGDLMVAGFTKAKVWKVPQHPLEEACELRMKS